jgi:hypothetical protein
MCPTTNLPYLGREIASYFYEAILLGLLEHDIGGSYCDSELADDLSKIDDQAQRLTFIQV